LSFVAGGSKVLLCQNKYHRHNGASEISMQEKLIQAALETAMLKDGLLSASLYEDTLTEFVDEMKASLNRDTDDALICLVADDDEVALMLVDWDGSITKNDKARERLKLMWRDNYAINVQQLIPLFASHLSQGMLAVGGIKWV
jgi:hypothetical protein